MTSTAQTGAHAAQTRAEPLKFSDRQQQSIHRAACQMVAAALRGHPRQLDDPTLHGAADCSVMGAFVTLKRRGKLRACCGTLGRPMALADAVMHAAVRTATEDARLPSISLTELPHLDLDVSLLYGFSTIQQTGEDRIKAVEVGRHGLQIQRGNAAGLLLPAVAMEQGYDAEQFLAQLCRKAGLPMTAWADDDTQIMTFEALSVPGTFADEAVGEVSTSPRLSERELAQLAGHCASNLPAIAQGATPTYYLPDCPDGTVHGLCLSLKADERHEPVHLFRLQLRPGLPLQSTLFSLTESAAAALRDGRIPMPRGNAHLGVSLLYDPAMHGTVAQPDLRGIDPQRRALLIMEAGSSAWVYAPEKSAEELFAAACRRARVFNPTAAKLFSFAVQSTDPAISVSTAPRAVIGPDRRPAAAAGTFYPADPDRLNVMVDQYLGEPPADRKNWPAVMVPHAGLQYSGHVAGQVFSKIEIPDTVVVISPKHTRLGVPWSLAPHTRWSIPGAELQTDRELVRQLVDAIPDLQLDAASHQGEHGIEVELPFLARLKPNVKVVGITIGAGDLQRCREFAEGMAAVLKRCSQQPLLVISSDLNHYAPDQENRRLDEIALSALQRLDPAHAYEAIVGHSISMCGLLPALIVMETLQRLGGLRDSQRVAYATSADASGQTRQVVGYGGMLFE